VEIKTWGTIPQFDFPVKSHDQLGKDLDVIDTQRAGKISGARFGYLKGDGVMLEMALLDLGFKTLIKKGFTPIFPPVMIKKEVMEALGYNNKGFAETYLLPDDNLALIATAEHAIVPYYKDEVLNEADLPKRFVGFSSAFRRESGSYGKDTKGIFRVHQFNKLEMVSFTRPEDSEKEHEFFLSLEEELMQALELPYHVLRICTGDLGDPAAAKYDIEAWFPSEGKYRETHSCSNCTDYQARRLNIKYRTTKNQQQITEYVHILNGSVFSERPILAILENYQQKDGSVLIPPVLRDYIGKDKISS
jgi:seryl-tRNA synthetase